MVACGSLVIDSAEQLMRHLATRKMRPHGNVLVNDAAKRNPRTIGLRGCRLIASCARSRTSMLDMERLDNFHSPIALGAGSCGVMDGP